MKFHLNYNPKKVGLEINHHSKVFMIGSCFAENIGGFLSDSKFKTCVNPNGILFNPTSIANALVEALQNKEVAEKFILEREGLFYSYLHHSSFSASKKADLIAQINKSTKAAHDFLKETDVLVITLGSAFIYHHKQLDQTAANCHKQRSENFNKRLLDVDGIVEKYNTLIDDLKKVNQNLKIIFTVSPVKYLKDGVEENNLSKSTLLLSIHKLVSQHNHCFYFPAYELVNDDLRDYRFYKADLAHPNQMAIDYVWQKFSETYFSPKTVELNQQIQKLNTALNHRQMKEDSLENEKLNDFIEKQRTIILKLNPELILD
jgi:hypothetical protein